MHTLNLGILAHVDAGKTTLTERLLHTTGAIDTIGSVDEGTTQTDSLAIERRRGITIRAAVAAITIGDLAVNIIDTPGHPDFIAEVERSLVVLDGAVLVVSAVEGVQAQTVALMRALQRLCVPTILFVNKVDRVGADVPRVLDAIRSRLTRDAVLLESFDADVAEYVAAETAAARAHPVCSGSAITGQGIDVLLDAIATLLPRGHGDAGAEPAAAVFKIERGRSGDKRTYLRVFDGSLRVRERVRFDRDRDATITAMQVFEPGGPVDRPVVGPGQIALVSGLRSVRIGDVVGAPPRRSAQLFGPPTLQAAVVPVDRGQRAALHHALVELAEQDPLIDVRQGASDGDLLVSLYGEVQQEVIEQTLAESYGIAIMFRDSSVICVERLARAGSGVIRLGQEGNPHMATVGLSVEPAPEGTGVHVDFAVEHTTIPLYVYKSVDAFEESMAEYVDASLTSGLSGWRVVDAHVTLIESGYSAPATKAGDVRKLTSLVLQAALADAGTIVCEPMRRFRIEAPDDCLGGLLRALARLEAVPDPPEINDAWLVIDGELAARNEPALRRRLHGLTHGEGVLTTEHSRYAPR